ncbi:MAG TPA: M23 family metallopeptidase [Pseudobdellovibrionaceae bacterium]|nr:M23 family metallopeptidase [Pseudobdellovibrionaceae bacterium]
MKPILFFCYFFSIAFLGVSITSCISRTTMKINESRQPSAQNEPQLQKEITPEFTIASPLPTMKSNLTDSSVYFDWPVDKARLTRGFLPNKRKPHLGIDLASPRGTPIFASAKGTVIYAGRDFRGYGKMVLIESTNEWATLYAHLDKIYVSEGQTLQMGDTLGSMGRTGRASGTHLHFELRKKKSPVNPLVYLPESLGGVRKISNN